MYIFFSFLTSPLDWVVGQHHAVATMPLRRGIGAHIRGGRVHPMASLDEHREETTSSPTLPLWGFEHRTIQNRYIDSWPHYRCTKLNSIPHEMRSQNFRLIVQIGHLMPNLKNTSVIKLHITLMDMSYLGKLENLSDVNHIAILFLPNPLKHKLKKKEKFCNGLKYKGLSLSMQ